MPPLKEWLKNILKLPILAVKTARLFKKINFFMNFRWTRVGTPCILCALFLLRLSFLSVGDDSAMNEKKYFGLEQEAEISALKKENSLLRNELSDVLLKYRKLEETRSALELGILGALYDPGQKSLSEREMQMLKDMLFIRKHVEALRDKISSLASEVDKRILNLDSLTEVDRAKLRCALDELNEESDNLRRIFRPVEEKNNFDKCSVLKI